MCERAIAVPKDSGIETFPLIEDSGVNFPCWEAGTVIKHSIALVKEE